MYLAAWLCSKSGGSPKDCVTELPISSAFCIHNWAVRHALNLAPLPHGECPGGSYLGDGWVAYLSGCWLFLSFSLRL
ncbi:hypothetical protein NPIL_424871 [Nephila pilipes]|uniref:Uncharacterized protein n=1 Tax=Nephila pilipes TaxID=299642 RepID=A0A8X6QGI5_NEPPI|nr:hypothetical protein NPIL_380621 [Nephila pilipes]GFS71509.1 hypothetical protein NPIL_632801 [Nephila pilipes]GFT72427.1 hypothetical protein NPIL_603221 [Nephila pilipes]GFU25998.1 hypothetical protein NPIL_424871 [Nephila pilipes]